MPSKSQLDDLHAREDAAIRAEADALAAAQAGDPVAASRLFEAASVEWSYVAHWCHVYAEDTTPADEADLRCWAGRAWLARVDCLTQAADQVRATSPASAERIGKMIEYCLAEAAKHLEACGSIRKEHGDPDGARGPLAQAESCLLLRRRLIRERDPEDPDVRESRVDLERVRAKQAEARRASRGAKKAKKKKKASRRKKSSRKRAHA